MHLTWAKENWCVLFSIHIKGLSDKDLNKTNWGPAVCLTIKLIKCKLFAHIAGLTAGLSQAA